MKSTAVLMHVSRVQLHTGVHLPVYEYRDEGENVSANVVVPGSGDQDSEGLLVDIIGHGANSDW